MVQDVVDTLLNMVRSPEMVMLDLRSMIACTPGRFQSSGSTCRPTET